MKRSKSTSAGAKKTAKFVCDVSKIEAVPFEGDEPDHEMRVFTVDPVTRVASFELEKLPGSSKDPKVIKEPESDEDMDEDEENKFALKGKFFSNPILTEATPQGCTMIIPHDVVDKGCVTMKISTHMLKETSWETDDEVVAVAMKGATELSRLTLTFKAAAQVTRLSAA